MGKNCKKKKLKKVAKKFGGLKKNTYLCLMFNQLNKSNMNTKQILEQNGLDFTISKRELFDGNGNGSGYFGLFNDRLNKCINTVKEGYTISQNEEVVEMVLQGIKPFGSDLRVTKAGSMNEGRKVFLQLGIQGHSKVANDIIERYVTIIDSNDGSTSLSVGIGDLTMSCQNQFFKFYKAGEAKFRHSASLEHRIKEIPFLIETALNQSLRQIEVYEQMANHSITRELADKMVKYLLGFDKVYTSVSDLAEKSTRSINKMDTLYNCIEDQINDKGLNLWGLHSGITKFTTHEISAPKRENGKLETIMLGNGYNMNQKSLEFVQRESGIVVMA